MAGTAMTTVITFTTMIMATVMTTRRTVQPR